MDREGGEGGSKILKILDVLNEQPQTEHQMSSLNAA